MAAFQAEGAGGLGHVPAVFLKLAEYEFAFVGAAGFVQGGVGLLGAFGYAAEEFGWQVVRFDAGLRANNYQAFDQVS